MMEKFLHVVHTAVTLHNWKRIHPKLNKGSEYLKEINSGMEAAVHTYGINIHQQIPYPDNYRNKRNTLNF
jgi:hypothetical protein